MKKFLKSLLAIMIIFMQLSSPTLALAETIEESTGNDEILSDESNNKINDDDDNKTDNENKEKDVSYEENKVTDESTATNRTIDNNTTLSDIKIIDDKVEENNNELDLVNKQTNNYNNSKNDFNDNNDEKFIFNVNAIVDNKIKVDITTENESKFIIKIKVIFNQIQDNIIKDKKEVTRVLVLDGKTIELDDIGANLNGEYNLELNVYKLEDSIENETEETLNNYISSKDSIFDKTEEKFHENKIETKLELYPTSNSEITCNNNECNLSVNASNKIVDVVYKIEEGNQNIDNSHVIFKINDKLERTTANFNFNNLLKGKYEIKAILFNQNNEEIANDQLVINYGIFSDNKDISSYFLSDNIENNDKIISMTLLNENNKNDLFDEIIGNVLSEQLVCPLITNSEKGLIVSEECYGKINNDDYLPLVSEIINVLNNNKIDATVQTEDDQNADLIENISTKMKLNATIFGITKKYTIIVIGDINKGLVDDTDANAIIDHLFKNKELDEYEIIAADVNRDDNVNMLDVSMIAAAICENEWLSIYTPTEEITPSLERENNNNIYVNDTFKINLKLSGFKYDYINGLEGLLNYDNSILELTSFEINDILLDFGKIKDNKFIQVGKQIINKDGIIATITFKALKKANTNVKVSDLIGAEDGTKLNIVGDASIDITIKEKEINNKPIAVFKEEKKEEQVVNFINNRNEENKVKPIENKIYYNNYLSKLEIKGYEIDFDKEVLEYSITVNNDVDSLDIIAIAEDSTSSVRIYGNNNFKDGGNIVRIIVTAKNGSERTYIINVNKKAKDNVQKTNDDVDDEATNNNTEKTIIIILIIMAIAGLLYLIFKDDAKDKE